METAAKADRHELCVLNRKLVCSMHIEGIQVGPPQFHFRRHFKAKLSRRRVLIPHKGRFIAQFGPVLRSLVRRSRPGRRLRGVY
jgi:hypothetical protein